MSHFPKSGNPAKWNRRRFLQLSLAGAGITGVTLALNPWRAQSQPLIPPIPQNLPAGGNGISPMQFCREFDYGTLKQENGRTIREFQLIGKTSTLQLNDAVSFVSWNFNGRVPGPTLRAKEGDRVRIMFLNQGGHSHSIHLHGTHPAEIDGIKPIRNGTAAIYEFDAMPYGVHLYHCHVSPIARHIEKGMHGMLIVDPKTGRPPADEMVMIMGGYDVDDNSKNELYAFNGLPDYYMKNPIPIYQNQLVRLYVLNLIEYEPAVTFHLHANFFQVYPTGMTLKPAYQSDVITMGTAERHILEFRYGYPGMYMFHPHQDAIAESGCMGMFNVMPRPS